MAKRANRAPADRDPASRPRRGGLTRTLQWQEAIFEGSRDAIFISDADSRFTAVNRAACELTGFTCEELLGMRIPELHEEVDLEAYREFHDRIMSGEESLTQAMVLRKDGIKVATEFNNRRIIIDGVPYMHTTARDISERRLTERLLREAADKYRGLVENAGDGICISQDGALKFVNPSMVRLSGYSEAELTGRSVLDFVHPDDRELVGTYTQRGLRGWDVPPSYEFRIVARDGTVRWARNSAVFVEWEGRPATLNVLTDVTARKQAENALRESETLYRVLFEGSPVPKLLYDPATLRFLEVNSAALQLYGYSRDEFLAMTIADLHPPEETDAALRVASKERPTPYHAGVWKHRKRDGTLIDVDISRQELVLGGRKLRVSVIYDITETTRLLHALEDEKERLRRLVEAAPFAIMQVAADGRVLEVNPKFTALFGYGVADVPDLAHWRKLAFPDPERRRAVEGWEREKADPSAIGLPPHTVTVRCKDGTDRTVVRHSFFTHAGERVISAADVTEERRLEDQLRHAQKMEAVGRLAGGVAHDFNNLLQAMLSQVQLWRLAGRPSGGELADFEAQIRRGAGLARQLLLFSRHEEVRRARLDLNELVRDAGALLRRLVRANIDLLIRPSDEPLLVEADPGQIDQVLMNLVVNACDAMPEGGRLTIITGHDDGSVWLAVEDSGSGIPEEIRDKIFEPYFTTKSGGHGTGLGLPVVHGIVTQHGGRLEVESQPAVGTTFRVLLPEPAGRAEPSEVVHEWADLPEGNGESVLLVEDEEAARTGLAQILASLGYRVTAVGSAADAGRLPDHPPFDVLLTDVMLSDVDGAALAHSLLGRWPGLKVVLMSGYSENEALRHAAELGDVTFLQKPFSMATLANAIHRTVAQRSQT
jgi:two-component system cell cycle sensor histidine kinase/response regulator CckA